MVWVGADGKQKYFVTKSIVLSDEYLESSNVSSNLLK
jgi:hypothetical protein